MMHRTVHRTVQDAGSQVASVLEPAAWEAWGGGSLDEKGERTGSEPEGATGLGRGAPAHETASTRAHILDTAERHFAEYGFAAVTMRHIALDAGLRNQASLYHHSRDKRALYEAALARGVEPIIALLAESAQVARSWRTDAPPGR